MSPDSATFYFTLSVRICSSRFIAWVKCLCLRDYFQEELLMFKKHIFVSI